MLSYLANFSPKHLLITSEAAFITDVAQRELHFYEKTNPPSPSVGRIWRTRTQICWVEPDPDDVPENPPFIIIKRRRFHLISSPEHIVRLRRELGVSAIDLIVHNFFDTADLKRLLEEMSALTPEPQPEKLVDRESRNSEILVSISIRIPNNGLTSVLDHVRPAIDVAAQIKNATVNIGIQPYDPNEDDEEVRDDK